MELTLIDDEQVTALTPWPLLIDAVKAGHQTRIGFEDTLTLPDGSAAASNRDLVAVAIRLAERFEGESA